MSSSFLEAHYYAGGLRHREYSLDGSRPAWAPPADTTGFADEFALGPETAAVEIRRLAHGQRRLTWLAVYHRSVDTRLGDRSNHAGMGIWLDELTVANARSLVHGLDVLAKELAGSVDPDKITAHATKFLADFVPKYLVSLAGLPDLPGLRFAPGRLPATKLSFIQSDQPLGEARLVGDEVLAALYSPPEPKDISRELICISKGPLAAHDAGRFQTVTESDDAASRIVRALPSAISDLTVKLERTTTDLETAIRERDAAQARSTDYDDLQSRVRDFEKDPLSVVLGAIREISSKIDGLGARHESVRPVTPTRPAPIQRPVGRPRPLAVEEETQPQGIDWFTVAMLGVLILFIVTVVFLLLDRYAGPLL